MTQTNEKALNRSKTGQIEKKLDLFNEKAKALKHVREVCPELMELNPNCLVEVEHFATGENMIVRYSFAEEEGYDVEKIIGHTPHLEHWHRAIPWDKHDFYYTLSGALCDRSRDNLVVMMFNTETGQPATEKDYQAYNKITS